MLKKTAFFTLLKVRYEKGKCNVIWNALLLKVISWSEHTTWQQKTEVPKVQDQ